MSSHRWVEITNTNVTDQGYQLWRHIDSHVWQVTDTSEAPATEAGYYNLAALLTLKGL